ncbi:undecaprenyl-phosphate glucose phosphotransferase [Tenacibaculum sp. SZ-18]|uniref:undecaprenyl-phosphate glucose phosphotransferase n=1 Tax=Tenacibaculum sp. SZ-18 TaxID=754423 RepID=UPI000C2D3712|nr:undecaprenyl-phosphate glucose phosphotransferase [Tenacibaculum sp. SZ-18]
MVSKLIRNTTSFLVIVDLLVINFVVFVVFEKAHQSFQFHSYISVFWLITAVISNYYKVYRFTNLYRLLRLTVVQALFFTLGFFAYFGIFKEGEIVNTQFKTLIITLSSLAIIKLAFYLILQKIRASGSNFNKVVFFEKDDTAKKMIKLFQNRGSLGYSYLGYFSNKRAEEASYLGNEKELYTFLENNDVDEIYATLSILKKSQIKKLTKHTSLNNITLKLIPDSKEFYSKSRNVQFYDETLKVLSVKKLPFDLPENRIIKRVFDFLFASFVCLFIISWLYPILWILIKLESSGPAIFKQEREGFNGEEFVCYKFRSMRINQLADKVHATKNDSRVTKIGAFLRKTSLDEIPQFFNVLLGSMSVVGPRPHLESLAVEYQKDVDNYLERHAVKPGITGLAQISGYRGEIRRKSDIKNRVRLDIFYIENWSFMLDVKIVMSTVLNVFKGDENAY